MNFVSRWLSKFVPPRVVEKPVYVPVYHSSLLSGHVALVTGGTRGIGNAIARAVLDSGGSCVITGRNAEAVARCVEQLRSRGQGAIYGIDLEMQDDASFPEKYARIVEMTGGIDSRGGEGTAAFASRAIRAFCAGETSFTSTK